MRARPASVCVDDISRRVKSFTVPYRTVMDFLNQAAGPPDGDVYIMPKALNLPDGYRVLHVFNDQFRMAFIFVLCHPTWPITVAELPVNEPIEPTEIEWGGVVMTRIDCT